MKALFGTIIIVFALFATPYLAVAATRAELLATIEGLRETLYELQLELQEKIFTANKDFRFERNLTIGSEGADVIKLQTFLGKNTQFYPEGLVTGYYGDLTSAAVGRLKREYGIVEPGFREESRQALNTLFQKRSTFVVSTSGFMLEPAESQEDDNDARAEEDSPETLDLGEIARDIHIQINQIRVQNKLNALDWDESLAQVALAHSQDQATDNINITDPEYLCQYPTIRHEGFRSGFSVRDRVMSAGVPFRAVGENIAMIPVIETRTYSFGFDEEAPTCPERDVPIILSVADEAEYLGHLKGLLDKAESVEPVTFIRIDRYAQNEVVDLAIDGWMESEGHRENILFPDYTHAGIGITKINEYLIITHNFIGR